MCVYVCVSMCVYMCVYMCVCVCLSMLVCVAQHICLGCSTHFRIKGRQCGALAKCQKCA